MLPHDLRPEQFAGYPPEARKLVTNYLPTLGRLPLSFVPSLLREAMEYDYKFPLERRAIERELAKLQSLSPAQSQEWFQAFGQIRLSSELERFDWINSPAQFVEQFSTYLWATQQLDAFRNAATSYGERLRTAVPPEALPVARLGIAVIGQGASAHDKPLFRKLRAQGAYYSRIQPENGLKQLLDVVAARAKAHPVPYGHWYIDGGEPAEHDPALTCVSYGALAPVRAALLRRIQAETAKPGMGPEALRTLLARMNPAELGMNTGDAVLDRFQVKLLTEASGTQIFSSTFAQWGARESLRRAQPCTLLVRFAPRQKQRPMSELLSAIQESAQLDPAGSLVDADFGAYYNWLNQQRLPGAEQSSFLAWFEDHGEALAIGPGTPRGTESSTLADLRQVLSWISE
jgi:hypothetical protein